MPTQNKIKAVKDNIARMIGQSATQQEIDLYVASEGLSTDDLKRERNTLERAGWQTLGGAVGGALTSPSVVGTPVGIGLGSSIAGQAYDLKEEYLGRKNKEPLAERSMGAAEDFLLDVISPAAISKGIYGIKKATAPILSKARGVFKPAEYSVFKKFGVTPTASIATQSRGLAAAEHALSDFMLTSDIFQKSAQKNIEALTFANRFLAKEYGPILSREEIGVLLKKAAPNVLERYSATYDKLFTRVGMEVEQKVGKVGIDNTYQTLLKLVKASREGPSTGIMEFAREISRKAAQPDGSAGLSWEAIKNHRTKIGSLINDPTLLSTRNIQQGHLKQLYAALTKDMEAAALKAGEDVHAKWRAANKYFEIKLTRDIPILEDIAKKQYPEEVFDIVTKSSKKGGTRLRLLRKQLSKKEWDAVAGTVLGKLGEQKGFATTTSEKVFSPTTFMTNWSNLSDSAKMALFRGGKYEKLVGELNDFVKVAGNMKEVERLANNSRTGSVLMFYGLLQTMASATATVAGGTGGLAAVSGVGVGAVGIPRMTAKLLTSDAFVKWLNNGIKISKSNPNAMSTHIGRLMALRFKEDIQEEVDGVIKHFLSLEE